jgi:transposase-like protein
MSARRHTEAEIAEAVSDYELGESADDIAVSMGVSSQTILNWVREAGVRVRPKGPGKLYLERQAGMR